MCTLFLLYLSLTHYPHPRHNYLNVTPQKFFSAIVPLRGVSQLKCVIYFCSIHLPLTYNCPPLPFPFHRCPPPPQLCQRYPQIPGSTILYVRNIRTESVSHFRLSFSIFPFYLSNLLTDVPGSAIFSHTLPWKSICACFILLPFYTNQFPSSFNPPLSRSMSYPSCR